MRLAPAVVALAFSIGGLGIACAANQAGRPAKPASANAAAAATCSREVTGSRIRRKEGDCAESSYPFRSMAQQDLEMTGAFTLRDAMRQLDPRF